MSEEQEKLIVEAVGKDGKVALMFDEDDAGRSCSQDALVRLVSQVYVKQIRLSEEGLQPDSLSEKEIKEILSFVSLKEQQKKERSDAKIQNRK